MLENHLSFITPPQHPRHPQITRKSVVLKETMFKVSGVRSWMYTYSQGVGGLRCPSSSSCDCSRGASGILGISVLGLTWVSGGVFFHHGVCWINLFSRGELSME